jgi:hypothetical protein
MRALVVGLSVLLMAGGAFGELSYTITGPGGVSSFAPTPGQVFPVTITIVKGAADSPDLSSWGLEINQVGGYQLAPFAGATTVYAPGVAQGWDPASAPGGWSGSANAPFPIKPFEIPDSSHAYGAPGPVMTFNVVAPATIPQTGSILGVIGASTYMGNADFEDVLITSVTPLTLTPEPISALLLLAGLPLLRRRR